MLWCSLELPQRGDSNEYPQHVFMEKKVKLSLNYHQLPTLSVAPNAEKQSVVQSLFPKGKQFFIMLRLKSLHYHNGDRYIYTPNKHNAS